MGKKNGQTVGLAFTGSFCTYDKMKGVVRRLVEEIGRAHV